MHFLFPILIGFLETLIINTFFTKLGNRKLISTHHFGLCLLYFILQTLNTIILSKTIWTFIIAIILTFLFACFFNIKLSIKLVYILIYSVVMALSESSVVMIITLSSNININDIQSNTIMYMIVIILSKFIPYIIFKFIDTKYMFSSSKVSFKFSCCILILPISTVFVIILLYICSFRVENIYFHASTFVAALLLIVANLLIFHIIDKQDDYISTKNKLLFAENHIKNQVKHYNELYNQQEELKKFKHDSKNIYIALLSKLKTMSVDEAIKQVDEKMQILFQNNVVNSGNPIIDALINSKMNTALKLGIKLNSHIKLTSRINIDELELAVLIGNALDNAIEASQQISVQDQKQIDFSLITVDDMISIKIINNINSSVNTNNLLTTKKNKSNHGYGINEIRSIVNKYNGYVDFICENKIFTLSACLINHSD